MNEANAFSIEMMNKIFIKLSENSDLLQLLIQSADIQEKGIQNIKNDTSEIKCETKEMNTKLDVIVEKLDTLQEFFIDLKNENRDLEQKITLMVSKLKHIEDSINSDDLEDYYGLCQSLYNNWDMLDDLTRKFIPVSEYLFSKLQKYNKPDYSPVIIELCRAIENEFLLKIFRKYTLDIIKRKGKKGIDAFLSFDKSSRFLCNKTGPFVKAISIANFRDCTPVYTLGQMNTILSLMNDKIVVNQSPLLKDFELYLADETVTEDLLSIQHIKKINVLVDNYRNPAAHPELMTLDQALKCKEIMPERLDYLMDCVKISGRSKRTV